MSCLKGKSESKPKPGRYVCKKCSAVSKKKSHICKPKKIKDTAETGKGKSSGKGKGTKK